MAAAVAFSEADMMTMSPIALVMKFNSFTKDTPKEIVFPTADVLTKRLVREPFVLADPIKFKLLDRLTSLAPHYVVRPLQEVMDSRSSAARAQIHLIVVVDVSGSMSSCIQQYQAQLKHWIDERMTSGAYTGVSIIFFASNTTGPFHDTSCLAQRQPSGMTNASPALRMAMAEGQRFGTCDVIFMTDGEFNDRATVYTVGALPNAARFTMLFPYHTPISAVNDHYSYLPRITPAGIPIAARSTSNANEIAGVLDQELGATAVYSLEKAYLSPIAGQYVMLNGMTVFQMNKLVEDLLQYPIESHEQVHNFFSHIVGMYNAMMLRSGDLLNTLRSPEMRLMWGFMQPLKKRFGQVPATHVHAATTSMVLEFLESFEAQLVDKRDKRLAELKKMPQSDREVVKEIEAIREAFSNMKKVDDYDRIMNSISALKEKQSGAQRRHMVKYYYRAPINVDVFKGFPYISQSNSLEIYKMIASLGVCAQDDPDGVELVVDRHCQGLLLAIRLICYRKEDDVRMTLTATQATRILFGFFVHQLVRGYGFAQTHCRVRFLIWKYCTSTTNYMILQNITNLSEVGNKSPDWIRILLGLATHSDLTLPASHPPADKTLWAVDPADPDMRWHLNKGTLTRMMNGYDALYLYRIITGLGPELQVRVTTHYPIQNVPFHELVIVRDMKEQTWREWRDTVVRVKRFSNGERIDVTNGMLLQETVCLNVDEFLARHWDCGHRKISKHVAVHPATQYGENSFVRIAVDTWISQAWLEYQQLTGFRSDSRYPIVPTNELRNEVVKFLSERAQLSKHPLFYSKDSTQQIPPEGVVRKMMGATVSTSVCAIVSHLASYPNFSTLMGDQQTEIALGPLPAEIPVFNKTLHPDIEKKIDSLIPTIVERLQPLAAVQGEGPHDRSPGGSKEKRVRTAADWEEIGLLLEAASSAEMDIVDEDFMCPLSGEVFQDPIAFGGHIFERTWLERWLQFDPRRSSPLTRETHDAQGQPLRILPAPRAFVLQLERYRSTLASASTQNGEDVAAAAAASS